MRIAHVSDFHYTHVSWNPFRLFPKRILATLNWVFFRKKTFSEEQLKPLPDLLSELKVDLVLFGGDFSTMALKKEFEKARAFTKRIRQPWVAIPGNHDVYTYRSSRNKDFYRLFSKSPKEITDPIQFFNLKNHRVEVHKLDNGYHLIALDTAIPTNPYSSEGLFSERQEGYLEEVLALLPKGEAVILFNHYPFFHNDEKRRSLIRGDALEALLKRHPQIRIYLHGHTHRHTIADLTPSNLPLILDSGCIGKKTQASFNLIDLEEKGCKVSTFQYTDSWNKTQEDEFLWNRGFKTD